MQEGLGSTGVVGRNAFLERSPFEGRSAAAPERALWAAILGDAIAICLGRSAATLNEIGDAELWITKPGTQFGSYSWCRGLLGFDENAIRQRLAFSPSRARRRLCGARRPIGLGI